MSNAENLLDNLTGSEVSMYSTDPNAEGHIVIGDDRYISVPVELRDIAVESDHNIETVTFDCPRYWDGHDLFALCIYINYKRADGYTASYPADKVRVDPDDESVIHFDWTLSKNVTLVKGNLTILVCAKSVDEAGNEELHWNSKPNKDMFVSEGLEVNNQEVVDENPDVITALLLRIDEVEKKIGDQKVENIDVGDGEKSLKFNDTDTNRALADNSISGGTDSISGCKGFYISAIDFENNKIYLSNTLVVLPTVGEGVQDLTFETPAYEVGNDIGIMFSSHRLYFATIAGVENNIITYNGDLGFDATKVKEELEGYEFFVPQHPEIGSGTFVKMSFGFGEMVRAIGYCCVAFGQKLFAGNFTGLFGRNNKASTYTLGGGYGTVSSATHALFSGVSHIIKGYCVGVIGANNKVNGVCTFVAGDGCNFESDYSSGHGVGLLGKTSQQHIVGSYNAEDKDAVFITGVGNNNGTRKNGLVVKRDGSATLSKQGTSEDSIVTNKTLNEKLSPFETIQKILRAGAGLNSVTLGGAYDANGNYSTAMGLGTTAKAYVSTAMGYQTSAEGGMSIAGNRGTIAKKDNSTALGQYNQPNGTDLFQIGNGTSDDDRKNAFVVKMDGSAEIQTQGQSFNSVVRKDYVDAEISRAKKEAVGLKTISGSYVGNGSMAAHIYIDGLHSVKQLVVMDIGHQGMWISDCGMSILSGAAEQIWVEYYHLDDRTAFALHTNDESIENDFNRSDTTYYWMAIVGEYNQ